MSAIHVPRNEKDISGISQKEGISAELLFKSIVLASGGEWRASSKYQNRKLHIDCFVGGVSFDIKAAKRIARNRGNGLIQDKFHWAEHTGITGYPGWTHSRHLQRIAFQMLDGRFLIVHRTELSNLLSTRVDFCRGLRAKCQHEAKNGLLWTRRGRKDAMTLFSTEQLLQLKGSVFWGINTCT